MTKVLMLVVAQEFDERDSAADSCDGAPKYRQATRMVEATGTHDDRSGVSPAPLEQPIEVDDDLQHPPLWLYRRNDYHSHYNDYRYTYDSYDYYGGYYSYGWTVSNGVDAEHCYGVYHHYHYHGSYNSVHYYDWTTDHVLIGSFRGGRAYDDKFAANVPTELVWDEVVARAQVSNQYDDCFDFDTRCWETTQDAFSVVSPLRCLHLYLVVSRVCRLNQ